MGVTSKKKWRCEVVFGPEGKVVWFTRTEEVDVMPILYNKQAGEATQCADVAAHSLS